MAKNTSNQQQNNGSSLPLAPNSQTLATRIFCENRLINLYDLCNAHDTLSLNSESFQKCKANFLKYKAKVDQAMSDDNIDEASLDLAIKADEMFRAWNLFDDNGTLNEDQLLEKMRKMYALERDNEISSITQRMEDDPLFMHEMTLFLNRYGIKDFDKFKANTKRGEPNKLRENLASDFALIQQSDPNNKLIKRYIPSITQQISVLPYSIYWIKEDSVTSHKVRDCFDKETNSNGLTPRQEFLVFMGKLLSIGEDITKKDTLPMDKTPAKSVTYSGYYDYIRQTSGNLTLSDEQISRAAAIMYKNALEGCWKHKQKCNPDAQAKRKDYAAYNVSPWISALVRGHNDIGKLAFLTGKEALDYRKSTNDMWKETLAAKHITVDHDIDVKYHPLFSTMDEKKLLNDIWNLKLIIGGSVHNAKTDATENTDGRINKCLVNGGAYYKAKISKTPNRNLLQTYGSSAAFECQEPDLVQHIRAGSVSKECSPISPSMDFFQKMMSHFDHDK